MGCRHRHKWLGIDLGLPDEADVYQIICVDCLASGEPAESGVAAWHEWLNLIRMERPAFQP